MSGTDTGITFQNTLKDSKDLNILTYLYYYNGAGVAVGDFNNDGWEDLYFVANQGKNQLYLNQQNFHFKEATPTVLEDNEGWSTGVTVVDINSDGLKDIYLCKVGKYRTIKGKNKLFVNKGLDPEGKVIFEEEAKKYNLDIVGFSTQASFFDYDLDGDLDMYLLNHSVHPNRTYGRGSKRNQIDSLSGDRLYRNNQGVFTDVSQETGIFQGAIGYGLGIATSDVNNDGYPDIYVGNDFFENDYLYVNQKDGTFKEIISSNQKQLQHTSHFSMGVDISDINNDGLPDILSLDMLPENLETYKSSGTEYNYTTYNQYLKNGYQPQYMQNALQLNRGDANFSEVAFFSGVAATEWSWAPLIADYDNDGHKDIFISNGIKGATNDMDFISFIANEKIQKKINQGMSKEDLSLINELPSKKTSNYFYQNKGDLTFENTSDTWAENPPSYSNGAVYVDLDNDGDLDMVINNVNEPAFVYANTSLEKTNHNYLKIQLKGAKHNLDAIGAKVILFVDGKMQHAEVFTTKGYLSSVSPILHFGLGQNTTVDSLQIYWPEGNRSILKNIIPNQTLVVNKNDTLLSDSSISETKEEQEHDLGGVKFKHQDFETKDFSIEPLAPYAFSNEGPHIAITDVDSDGRTDFVVSGGKLQSTSLFLQSVDGDFIKSRLPSLETDQQYEDVQQCFLDADQDGDQDLITIFGGNENYSGYQSPPALYINNRGIFTKSENSFADHPINASVVVSADIDKDGDLDLFVGSNSVPGKYGVTPKQYIFKNDGKGVFEEQTAAVATELLAIGQVTDAAFIDLNNDDFEDLILVGHYIPITILMNDGKGNFKREENHSLKHTNGWWNCLIAQDMDKDGDIDIIAGNWGLNTRLTASVEEPLRLYLNDFDKNGKKDPIVTYFYKGKETPIATKDELSKQIPVLNKKFLSYTTFAKAGFKDYFSASAIEEAEVKQVFTLATTYFENKGNRNFEAQELSWEAQISSVHAMHVLDINRDEYPDIVLGGNTYEVNTQLGRLDASYGSVLLNTQKGTFEVGNTPSLNIKGAVRSIQSIDINQEKYLLFGINNDSLQLIKITTNE